MPSVAAQRVQVPVGNSIPALLPHAISVSLPTWEDNVAYEEGEPWIVAAMQTGYPRFFIHKSIQKLASLCLKKFGTPQELCLLLPTPKTAQACRAYLLAHSNPPIPTRIVEFVICPEGNPPASLNGDDEGCLELQIILFPKENWPLVKSFWQHTGLGISSRRAERGLALLGEKKIKEVLGEEAGAVVSEDESAAAAGVQVESSNSLPSIPAVRASYSKNRHYSRSKDTSTPSSTPSLSSLNAISSTIQKPRQATDAYENYHNRYIEQRYGRNLPPSSAAVAKLALRRRIAGVLEGEEISGGRGINESDVWLFPTGMTAIWTAHQAALAIRKGDEKKSVCFGFPYADTLKVFEKWGPGCTFLGHGLASDITALSELLASSRTSDDPRPVLALICEFPSNPLLRSADLVEIRRLADEYGFVVIVDETVGNFVNVEVMEWSDVVVSSLTKVFSGETNVMGGSLVLNPLSKHYPLLKAHLEADYEDVYFGEDAIFMERNSRDFLPRIKTINSNAEHICDLLRARSLASSSPSPNFVIKDVLYPKWTSSENYLRCRRPAPASDTSPDDNGRFGGLFSLTFTNAASSKAFFDALDCVKGPSLGTNFTLASPYVILAHYQELDWAAQYGVESTLVRVSVGMEDEEVLKIWFEKALDAAEKAALS